MAIEDNGLARVAAGNERWRQVKGKKGNAAFLFAGVRMDLPGIGDQDASCGRRYEFIVKLCRENAIVYQGNIIRVVVVLGEGDAIAGDIQGLQTVE